MATITQPNANSANTAQGTPTKTLWPTIGKAWITPKGGINLVIGNRRGGVEQVGAVTFNRGDRMYLRPNNKRPGKKDADYQICLPQ